MFRSKIGSVDPGYKGDSGGPLFCSMEDGMMRLSGIYSYGRCGDDETKPSVRDQRNFRFLEGSLSYSHGLARATGQEALETIFAIPDFVCRGTLLMLIFSSENIQLPFTGYKPDTKVLSERFWSE